MIKIKLTTSDNLKDFKLKIKPKHPNMIKINGNITELSFNMTFV